MNEVLTRTEMKARFQWKFVLVADPEMDEDQEVHRGRVVYHSADWDAVYKYSLSLPLKVSRILSFGSMPKHLWLSGWKYLHVANECATPVDTLRGAEGGRYE